MSPPTVATPGPARPTPDPMSIPNEGDFFHAR